jgi:uncharacterized protein (TIGR03663 family)
LLARIRANRCWIDLLILAVAAVFRLWALELKPAHFDEGVNGYFVDEMTKRGLYTYDPTNFHGPLHFYVLFCSQSLLGRSTFALRLPTALVSIACVALALFTCRRFLSASACRWGAFAMAVSPGFVFYGRYAIHETWLVFFLMLMVVGGAAYWLRDSRRDLWLALIGLIGIILTKETWLIHVAALILGAACTWIVSKWLKPTAETRVAPRFRALPDDLVLGCAAGIAVIAFFYSGGLLEPSGIRGFFKAYSNWFHTGTRGESGHEKPWYYWIQLLGTYEWPVFVGLVAALVAWIHSSCFVRWLAIASVGTFAAYSIVAYKTPWCLIAWAWPFCLFFGIGTEWLMKQVDRWIFGVLAASVCLFSAAKSNSLNWRHFADENEPYVYVQTTTDINKLLEPLRWQISIDPTTLYNVGHVIQPEHHPLLWLLADRPNVTMGDQNAAPEPLDADWLLVDETARDRIETGLTEPYYRERVQIRGMAPDRSILYLRVSNFAEYFRDRTPEFRPAQATPPSEADAPTPP